MLSIYYTFIMTSDFVKIIDISNFFFRKYKRLKLELIVQFNTKIKYFLSIPIKGSRKPHYSCRSHKFNKKDSSQKASQLIQIT